MTLLFSFGKTLRNTWTEVRQAWLLGDTLLSSVRLSSDFFLYRILKITNLPSYDQERTIICANGVVLTYRLNRGDIQGIREVFLDEAYRLPFSLKPDLVVDLGANIGLTSIWFSKNYRCDRIIAVEPDPKNAILIRKNFAQNKINGIVIEAAIGLTDGMVSFETSQESNLGRVAPTEELLISVQQVKMISMETLFAYVSKDEVVDLVKMDIEGGEQQLLSGDISWLKRVRAMIAEFHPDKVDYPGLIELIEQQGFRYIHANSVHAGNMDAFLCESLSSKQTTKNEIICK